MALLYALCSAFLGSLGTIVESFMVYRRNPGHVPSSQRMASSCYVNAFILGLILFFNPSVLAGIQMSVLTAVLLLIIGFMDSWYNILNLKALEISPPSKVTAIFSTNPLITLLISTFFLGTKSPPTIFLIVFLVVLGIYIINLDVKKFSLKHFLDPFEKKSVRLPCIAALLAGVSALITAFTLKSGLISEFPLLFIRMLFMAVYTHIHFKTALFPKQYKKSTWLLILFGTELIFVISRAFYTFSLGMGDTPLVATLSNSGPLFVLVLAVLLLKEKLTRHKMVGTLLVVSGISLSVFQGL